jgi:hypothetical protein
MKRLSYVNFGSLLVIFFLSLAAVAAAKTITKTEDNFSIDLPETWNSAPRPGAEFSAQDADNTSSITIGIFTNRLNQGMQQSYIDQIKNSLANQGRRFGGTAQVLKENSTTIGGAPAYLIECRMDLPQGQTVYVHHYSIFTREKVYALGVQTYDAGLNSQMDEVAQSFRFFTAPELPDATGSSPSSREVSIPGEGMSISLPADWTTQSREDKVLYATDNVSTVSIKSYPYPSQGSPQAFIGMVKKDAQEKALQAGAKVDFDHEGPTTLAGVPGYFVQGTLITNDNEWVYTCEYAIAANGKLYAVILSTADPDRVSAVEGIARSLKFEQPPEVPDVSIAVSDYERGFRMGQITFYILLAAAVARGGFLIWRRITR